MLTDSLSNYSLETGPYQQKVARIALRAENKLSRRERKILADQAAHILLQLTRLTGQKTANASRLRYQLSKGLEELYGLKAVTEELIQIKQLADQKRNWQTAMLQLFYKQPALAVIVAMDEAKFLLLSVVPAPEKKESGCAGC